MAEDRESLSPKFQLSQGPKGADLERWLAKWDATPTVVPTGLPASDKLALVCDVLVPPESPEGTPRTVGIVVTSESLLCDLMRPDAKYPTTLFFTIPRAELRKVLPDLSEEDFDDQ